MTATQATRQGERVATWPRITATIHGPSDRLVRGVPTYIGSLTINGTERPCEAGSVEELRTGMIARCVAIATRLHRPVRLTVDEGAQSWTLGVRPEGYVQPIDGEGMIPAATGLTVHEGRCRQCRRLLAVTVSTCPQCGSVEPHRVEPDPVDAEVVVPPASSIDELEATQLRQPAAPAAPARPVLRLTINSQTPVEVRENIALGRRPEPIEGRRVLAIDNPSRQLSRTHALIDVDEHGRILVTDHDSANGIEAQTDPPAVFTPGTPYVIEPGTTLIMGDVTITIDIPRG